MFANVVAENRLYREQGTQLDARKQMLALTDQVILNTWAGNKIKAAEALREQRRLFGRLMRDRESQ